MGEEGIAQPMARAVDAATQRSKELAG